MVNWVLCGFADVGCLFFGFNCCVLLMMFLLGFCFYLLVSVCVTSIDLYCLIHLEVFFSVTFCLRFDLVCLALFVLAFVLLYLGCFMMFSSVVECYLC